MLAHVVRLIKLFYGRSKNKVMAIKMRDHGCGQQWAMSVGLGMGHCGCIASLTRASVTSPDVADQQSIAALR